LGHFRSTTNNQSSVYTFAAEFALPRRHFIRVRHKIGAFLGFVSPRSLFPAAYRLTKGKPAKTIELRGSSTANNSDFVADFTAG
jgi:hypothetical protein